MLCEPTASVLVTYVATPVELSMLLPSVVTPSLNVTVPVGSGVLEVPATVAVKVRLAPRTLVGAELSVVVVAGS
jgi:hypothetical protein